MLETSVKDDGGDGLMEGEFKAERRRSGGIVVT